MLMIYNADKLYSNNSQHVIEELGIIKTYLFEKCNELHSSQRKWRVPKIDDPIFGEFILLQEKPSTNLTGILLAGPLIRNSKSSTILALCLEVLHGVLLLHPPSRDYFTQVHNMEMMISFLKSESGDVVNAAVQCQVAILVRNVLNFRLSEALDGPKIICELLNSPSTLRTTKMKILEFLFFYLIPEEGTLDGVSSENHKNTKEKAEILKKYLRNVDGLVEELMRSKPFGEMDIQW
ncbi:BA75_02053T0 [Komagataella pastoris]|uniref:BA75_02053T0 n=1 Tax=Komagataella pastoris TaxID=4922 RepID=A0A1B2JDX2_PICPA|nr:BA75_02053T0 [Komagataella pastoris]